MLFSTPHPLRRVLPLCFLSLVILTLYLLTPTRIPTHWNQETPRGASLPPAPAPSHPLLPRANPPVANPPGANPPVANPPGANPPGANQPAANPPVANPPGANPPKANPPKANPPVANPPVSNPPGTNPPGSNPPDIDTPYLDQIVHTTQFPDVLAATLVFVHIQKTGGKTFRRHLLYHLPSQRHLQACVCRRRPPGSIFPQMCACERREAPTRSFWLFAAYSLDAGWPCGVHPDHTELQACVQPIMDRVEGGRRNRSYHYITILREPVSRYLSEYRHVQRNATWRGARLICSGHAPAAGQVRPCYDTPTWHDVTLSSFLTCDSNLAHNRMTRMLADLTLVGCYNTSGWVPGVRENIMLTSAKHNLRRMPFFGLTEYQRETQFMFERTFNVTFNVRFDQHNSSRSEDTVVSQEQLAQIHQRNALDLQLYEYAKELFFQRFKYLRKLYGDL